MTFIDVVWTITFYNIVLYLVQRIADPYIDRLVNWWKNRNSPKHDDTISAAAMAHSAARTAKIPWVEPEPNDEEPKSKSHSSFYPH